MSISFPQFHYLSLIHQHSCQLGGLLANLQSLEFILRAYLQKHSLPTPTAKASYGTDFYSFPVGTELPENEITNYNSLGQLIEKFNALMRAKGLDEIDNNLN